MSEWGLFADVWLGFRNTQSGSDIFASVQHSRNISVLLSNPRGDDAGDDRRDALNLLENRSRRSALVRRLCIHGRQYETHNWQSLRARRNTARFEANGFLATVINVVIFFALYFTYTYASSIDFMSDAVLIFYGLSMLLAALRGYGGCESLAISNWLLKRDDQLGCLVFSPIDSAESKVMGRSHTTENKY